MQVVLNVRRVPARIRPFKKSTLLVCRISLERTLMQPDIDVKRTISSCFKIAASPNWRGASAMIGQGECRGWENVGLVNRFVASGQDMR